jgi:hypothetical protein
MRAEIVDHMLPGSSTAPAIKLILARSGKAEKVSIQKTASAGL